MKHLTINSSERLYRLTFWVLLLVVAGCTKVVPVNSLKAPDNNPDTTRDVRKLLDSVPDFSLFAQACKKTSITGGLDPAAFFTLFVPTDSAMKAAGLTADVINNLSADSLTRLLNYHITYNGVSDTTLINAIVSIQQNCLLQTLFFNPSTSNGGYSSYRHALFVKYYGGVLNINGWAVNAGEPPVRASNGYLYPVHQVLRPPTQRIWDIINARPELSYYVAAIDIMDSVYAVIDPSNYSTYSDSVLFSQLRFEQVAGQVSDGISSVHPTVFAPTNTAFINAGLADIPSIRQFILGQIRVDTVYQDPSTGNVTLNYIPGQGYQIHSDGGAYGVTNYFPMDSVLKSHYLYNAKLQVAVANGGSGDLSVSNSLCYSDLTGCSSINDGVLNVTSIINSSSLTPIYNLRFSSGAGGLLNIQWNAAGTNDAVIPKDSSQLDGKRNFWALNGVVYESDRLFLNK